MDTLVRARTLVCLPVVGLLMVLLLAPPGTSAMRVNASLHISPDHYIGGQRLTFEGNIGRTGERRVHLQINLSRPGDEWKDVDDFRGAMTRRDGSFEFDYIAPSMFGIRMRVVSGRSATPAVTFRAMSQDLVVEAPPEVMAGDPFTISVDTTPNSGSDRDLARRTDLPPPAYPGRVLNLQQRTVDQVGVPSYTDQWTTIATTTADRTGQGVFEGVTATEAGTAVYRVRQEAWTEGGSKIGWYPSFPTYVDVLGGASGASPATVARTTTDGSASRLASAGQPITLARDVASTTAAETYEWRPSLWDYGWTYGESLSSGPSRGSDPVGRWVDWSDGTGRAAKHNGGVMLDTQRQNRDDLTPRESYGTTAITLRGNPMRYGRWEVRMRTKSTEGHAHDPQVLIELVPDNPADYHCGAQNITVADLTPHGSNVRLGVRNLAGAEWTRTLRDAWSDGASKAFGVEVTRGHVTWFMEGKVVGTTQADAALSGVPMTLRISMAGDGLEEINRSQAISDWQRGYSLERGRQKADGPSLNRGTFAGGC